MTEEKEKDVRPEPEQKLREVHRVWGPAEAEVVKTYLESHGISCFFRGKILHAVYPFSADGLGEIRIYVLEKDYETAKELLTHLA